MTHDNAPAAPDTVEPPGGSGSWTFDSETVATQFEEHISNSVPNYEQLREFVTKAAAWKLSRSDAKTPPLVVDLGASQGSALQPIVDKVGARARYAAVEVAPPMVEILKDRFGGWIDAGRFQVLEHDLREGYPAELGMATVVISALTLMFIPIEHRQRLLRDISRHLVSGGIFILVEKVLPSGAELDELMNDVYHGFKAERGYGQETIERKALSLEGVLVPLTARFDEELLLQNGFDVVDCGWAWGPFRGWVAVKR